MTLQIDGGTLSGDDEIVIRGTIANPETELFKRAAAMLIPGLRNELSRAAEAEYQKRVSAKETSGLPVYAPDTLRAWYVQLPTYKDATVKAAEAATIQDNARAQELQRNVDKYTSMMNAENVAAIKDGYQITIDAINLEIEALTATTEQAASSE